MPFARTWSEELVAEWLTLEGYFVEISAPIGAAKAGGRNEADVLACKIAKGVLEIIRAEVGIPANIETFRRKFSKTNREGVKRYCRKKLNFEGEIKYREFYVASYISKPLAIKAKKEGFEVKHIKNLVKDEIIPSIEKWKKHPPFKVKTKDITPQNSLWLIQLIDMLVLW